jgi:hypothetical protein
MHKKYGKEGLAAVSVALDDPSDKESLKNVREFLEAKKATFTNLILDEKPEVWQEKLKIDGPPCVMVFGRDGKVAKKFAEDVDYKEIEKLAVELLKKK